MDYPSISVVIPSCHRPEFLAEAIAHVCKQTLKPNEIIVVFDQDEREPLAGLVDIPLITTVTGGGAGASMSRNIGAGIADSTWLAFLDDDDWWLPDYLETVHAAALMQQANMVCASFLASIDGKLQVEKSAPVDLANADFFTSNPGLRGSNCFIKKSLFESIGGFEHNFLAFNDVDFGIRLAAAHSLAYVCVSKRLVVIRKHSGPRISGRDSTVIAAAIQQFYERYQQKMSNNQKIGFRNRIKHYWNTEVKNDL